MKWRSDRVYIVKNGTKDTLPPRVWETGVYTCALWEGHSVLPRPLKTYPRWKQPWGGDPLRLLKNTYELGHAFITDARKVVDERFLDVLNPLCPDVRILQSYIDKAFHLSYRFEADPGLSSSDSIRCEVPSGDPHGESVDAWLERLARRYKVPPPDRKFFELIPPTTAEELADFPITRKIPFQEFGGISDATFRKDAVERYGYVSNFMRADVLEAVDQFLQRPFFQVIPVTMDGIVCLNELRLEDQ